MTEPLNPDYCVNCQKCGKQFEMVWGQDNDVCEECNPKPLQSVEKVFIAGSPLDDLIAIRDFYANPENWRRFPIEDGVDANGSPVQQYWWIGDGGEFARGSLE